MAFLFEVEVRVPGGQWVAPSGPTNTYLQVNFCSSLETDAILICPKKIPTILIS
jgi:hypothetical protein